jgi:hypothetical protein
MYWNVIFPSNPSGQITSLPWYSYVLNGGSAWQPAGLTWSFEEAQDDFQLEILLECENTSPVWIDMVQVNPVTAP